MSIIIPTKNSAKTLYRALDSIIHQDFTDYEVLVVDGGSTDNTVGITESLHNSKIQIISELDEGIYDAMNKGIAKSSGKWLYFLGSDDWLLNNSVLSSVFAGKYDSYDVIYCNVEFDGPPPIVWENGIMIALYIIDVIKASSIGARCSKYADYMT